MAAAVEIREAEESDLGTLASLYESTLDPPELNDARSMSAAWHRMHAEVPGVRVLLAERDGRALGTLTCFILPLLAHGGRPAALVEDVVVHPDAQGQGIGRALMDAAMQIARDARCYKLALSSNRKRERAHEFYDHLGFERHGISFVAFPEETS